MTLEETLRRATAIIGNAPACRKDIEVAFYERQTKEQERGWRDLSQNKEARKKLRHFKNALMTLRAAFRELPDALRYPFLSSVPSFLSSVPFLIGSLPEGKLSGHGLSPSDCDVWIDICKKFEKQHHSEKPKRSDGFYKKLAAAQAIRLMRKYKLDVTTAKDSDFCRLAALLAGEPKADLRRYCRAARDITKPG